MITFSLSTWLNHLKSGWWPPVLSLPSTRRPNLSALAQWDEGHLPRFVRESDVALKYLHLLGPMDWGRFPDRPDQRFSPTCPPMPYAPFVAAYLVKIDQHIPYVADLREYLVQHPALVWVLGFPLVKSLAFSWGFDVQASLPTHRHLSRLLRCLPNASLQFLLDETVRLLQAELHDQAPDLGDCISLDTKHIIAWVKENTPKPTSKVDAMTRNGNQPAIPIAAWAVSARPTKPKAKPPSKPGPLRRPTPFQPATWRSASTTGATPQASLLPR
jgi:hypothetical protein